MARVGQYLLEDLFSGKNGRKKLFDFCRMHPDALVAPNSNEYNFYINGDYANYWIRAITRVKDYNLYVHTFVK